MISLNNIKNIILDLGKVILEIHLDKTITAFKEFGFSDIDDLDIVFSRYKFFEQFELGLITSEQFVSEINKITDNNLPGEVIVHAWNAMIGRYINGSVSLIRNLNKKYRMFLLSNTNAIHEKEYNKRLTEDHGITNLADIFDMVYYSHVLHLSKPNIRIFEYVLKDSDLKPEETLYIDDILVHIESAAKLGIQVFHLAPPLKITDIFDHV